VREPNTPTKPTTTFILQSSLKQQFYQQEFTSITKSLCSAVLSSCLPWFEVFFFHISFLNFLPCSRYSYQPFSSSQFFSKSRVYRLNNRIILSQIFLVYELKTNKYSKQQFFQRYIFCNSLEIIRCDQTIISYCAPIISHFSAPLKKCQKN